MGSFIGLEIDPGTLRQVVAGDAAASRFVYGNLAGPCFALVRRLVRDRAAAEDVFQDAMLAIFQGVGGYRGEAPFGAWARQVVLRCCFAHLRSPWQRARHVLFGDADQLPQVATAGPVPAQLLDLARALERLSPTDRAVLWLHDAEGLSHEQIAAGFGRTTSFSKSRLVRARASLRALLSHTEETPCQALKQATAPSP